MLREAATEPFARLGRWLARIVVADADVLVANKGQTNPVVDLTVVDVGGAPLVDDMHYLIDAKPGRSVYSYSCTGSFGT